MLLDPVQLPGTTVTYPLQARVGSLFAAESCQSMLGRDFWRACIHRQWRQTTLSKSTTFWKDSCAGSRTSQKNANKDRLLHGRILHGGSPSE